MQVIADQQHAVKVCPMHWKLTNIMHNRLSSSGWDQEIRHEIKVIKALKILCPDQDSFNTAFAA